MKGPGWQGRARMAREEIFTLLSAFKTKIRAPQPRCQQGAPLCFHHMCIMSSKLLQACSWYSVSQVGAGTSDSLRGVRLQNKSKMQQQPFWRRRIGKETGSRTAAELAERRGHLRRGSTPATSPESTTVGGTEGQSRIGVADRRGGGG